eukprot:6945670-Lingulodinium_polyedra.AAC.1
MSGATITSTSSFAADKENCGLVAEPGTPIALCPCSSRRRSPRHRRARRRPRRPRGRWRRTCPATHGRQLATI